MPTAQRPELNALFNLPPNDAIDYLKSKGFKIGWDWHETLDDAHSRAFTVAKVARIDLLSDIRKSLITAMEQGQTLEQWKASITPTLQDKGWWGKKIVTNPEGREQEVQLGSPRRLRTIYDTNMQSAFAAGRYKAMLAGSETRPYWEWRHITLRNPRKQHVALNGRIFRYDDPFWNVAYPPSEWGCKCRIIARSAREIGEKEVLDSDGYATEITEVVGKDRATGMNVVAKRTQFRIPTQSGTLTFAPAAGFNGSPSTSYLLDKVLAERATALMGNVKGLQQVQQMLLSKPRLKAHESFVRNALSFGKPQNRTSTVGVLHLDEIQFLSSKNKLIESPIMTVSDHLLVGKKAERHSKAGNALNTDEWIQLSKLIAQAEQVVWDVKNDSMLYILPAMTDPQESEVIKLSIREAGVMEIVSIFKVKQQDIAAGLKSNLYEKIR
ncbi:phage head morphogenesis protein [Acinetobacter pittii]|uniref:phage head morphogenesis protein n=1 Tax=Acinetobacter pittii TaxID=48296 RepID=UPI000837D2B1|nr:phage minor head protein [Acinetobacter pittii]MCK0915084.1 phage head morphogenesis protein [Acinetobacter pittii]